MERKIYVESEIIKDIDAGDMELICGCDTEDAFKELEEKLCLKYETDDMGNAYLSFDEEAESFEEVGSY